MGITELKQSLQAKTLQYEVSIESGAAHAALLELYKEIKELRYQILVAEMSDQRTEVTE